MQQAPVGDIAKLGEPVEDVLPVGGKARQAEPGRGSRTIRYCGLARPSRSTSAFSRVNVSWANLAYCAESM